MTNPDFDGNIDPQPSWADVPQLSTKARALGGEGGPMNAQAVALAARTKQLQKQLDVLNTPGGAGFIGYEDGSVAGALAERPTAGELAQSTGADTIGYGDKSVAIALGERPTSVSLAGSGGSELIGHGANTVKDALDARPTAVALAAPTGAGMVGFTQDSADSVSRSILEKSRDRVSVKDFGASGLGLVDDTEGIQKAINYAVSSKKALYIPSGIYRYTSLTGLDNSNLTIVGDGSNNTVLKCINAGIAFDLGTSSAFRLGINLHGITIEGNADTSIIVRATALAHCQWHDVNAREANRASGVGFQLRGCMLSQFSFVECSQNRQAMVNAPSEAFQIQALSPFGNSANNTFINLYAEGAGAAPENSISIGIRMSGGSQNLFLGGSPEACKTWGLLIGADCNYNTLIGVGFENLNASGGDFADGGRMTRFVNCYASQKVVLQSLLSEISGGYYERIQIDASGRRNKINGIVINQWNTGVGGIYDSGIGTETKDVYDADIGDYLTDIFPRFLMSRPSTASDVTGDGTAYTIPFGTIYDDNKNTNGTQFTAPIKGRYQLQASVTLTNVETSATAVNLKIVTTKRVYLTEYKPNLQTAGSNNQTISVAALADMDEGDTAYVVLQVSGMTKTVDVLGNVTNAWSTFSGYKVH